MPNSAIRYYICFEVKKMTRYRPDCITWSSRFAVGIKIIDDQHKGLLHLINDMFNHVVGDEAEERLYFKSVIQQAVKYIKVHFNTEEKIMIHTRFPGYKEHKKEHDTFIFTVIAIAHDFKRGKRLVLSDFTRFLKNWVFAHIAVMDKQCFSYIKETASRKSDGKLSVSQEDERI